jgi:hypothetical protein
MAESVRRSTIKRACFGPIEQAPAHLVTLYGADSQNGFTNTHGPSRGKPVTRPNPA